MHILNIDSKKNIHKVDKMISQGKDVFILVYMVGCGPCNATRPEWTKIEGALKNQYANNDRFVIIDVNKDLLDGIKKIGSVDGFPTIKYIGNYGKIIEPYEESSVKKKDRSVNSFVNWIESKINKSVSTAPTSSAKNVYHRISKTRKHNNKYYLTRNQKRQHKTGGRKKWSKKHKSTIQCDNPKGFSQKQYCKYGRNK